MALNHNKNNKKQKYLLLIIAIQIIVIIALFIGIKIYTSLRSINYDDSEDDNIIDNEIPIPHAEEYRNLVIFGVDSRENALKESTNSDTIIIVSINNDTKEVKLASIYRDTYVYIPDKGYNKINAAYFKGGYSLALSTINTNFDLNIKEYITVNFRTLVTIIDKLGGISLDVKSNELNYLNGYVKELNRINNTNSPTLKQPGTQVVNGTQATAYARIRYTSGGDFKRTERQRIIIDKLFQKAKETDIITLSSVVEEILPQIYTNLNTKDILNLAKDILAYSIIDQTGFPFEKDAHNYKKVSYVFPINLEDNVVKLHQFFFADIEYEPSQRVKDYSAYIEAIRRE
ncbi:MAG: LCP family protein [Clostridiales bacterium]|nr:LCP family protein [Clostridiales bacterium]